MWRLFGVLFLQAACAAIFSFLAFQFKFSLDFPLFAILGALFGGLVWLFFDANNSRRYLDWLRSGDATELPKLGGIWREATDRTNRLLREKNKNLQLSNQRLNDFLAAIQASPNGVVLLDKNTQIEWCNLTAASHFGLNPSADISQHIGNLVRDPDFAAYLSAGDFERVVIINGKNSTGNRSSRLAVQIHPYGQGKQLLLSNDITAIEAAEFMRRDFAANVSHEIRTPLTVLSGFVETLQTLNLDEHERAKYLNQMGLQAQRMQLLVSDLLTLSRLEGSPTPSAETWIKVNVLEATCALEAKALQSDLYGSATEFKGGQSLTFDIQSGLEFAGSQTELLSAMCNLVNNAVRYTPKTGEISVSLHALDQGGAKFTVNDSGLGIDPEHLPRLTERFYRVDTSRSRESGGTGLGLAIVKHVVQRHGGELKISSIPGTGSTFSFTLPAHRVRTSKLIAAS